MSYRFMRVIVFFDLPVKTPMDRRNYRIFRNFLIKNGFLMLQNSVYCKLSLNGTATEQIIAKLRKNKPKSGIVQVIAVTEKQFSRMEYITGEFNSEVLCSDERLIVL